MIEKSRSLMADLPAGARAIAMCVTITMSVPARRGIIEIIKETVAMHSRDDARLPMMRLISH
jgi:hypothetical protein